ncbi:glycerol-3-phosphate 1-O-acyltransferase [Nostocoides sp. F2B08]|uniref:glycerol-3-phosphate 1-O-acyltransferase n=1 Tax=Nostocoides sp. F2B08 TaxID=2653936 RepID=UPI0012630851|nr:glycerol-3-phosphate 1-O-acyltransferase [Tetrasphaera sp. F2B08]KAB7745136.1 glycerol-3-phosphate 1-O-acyltransferase [Tetrasphaera sp. F2B08]
MTPPRSTPTPVLALMSGGASPTERRLIEEWAASSDEGRGVTKVIDEVGLAAELPQYAEALILPVRVAWLPSVQRDESTSRWSELALMATPRRPASWIQRRLAARDPERQRVLTGAPALLSQLRSRHRRAVGSHAEDPEDFARFVRRAAIVALDRAERSFIGDRYKVPHHVAEEISSRAEFRSRLVEIAQDTGISEKEAIERAEAALGELVAVQSRAAVDLFQALMDPLHSSTWNVIADESGLGRLRELNKKYALVFLPSHRSYVDTLVLGDVLARNDFPRNHVMGGANLRIWPISNIARRAGLVFIRRSFGDDKIYKAVVEEYFGYLLSKRFNLEWYFEGGRSRTGKLRSPRYGLLSYVAQAVTSGRVEDVYLVPVSITYDRLYEVAVMAAEQAGAAKQPEGLKWLAKYARSQRSTTGGNAHVRFGEPLSLATRMAPADAPDADQRIALQKVAFEVAVGINSSTPITANALLTLTLLGVRDQAQTVDEILKVIAPILDYIEKRGLPTTGLERLRDALGLQTVLTQLVRAKVVTAYEDGEEPVYAIERGQHLVAAFYRNNAIHWFITRAILELSILHVAERMSEDEEVSAREIIEAVWDEANTIRDQLKFEFFFPTRRVFVDELRDEMDLLDPDWEDTAPSLEAVRNVLAGSQVLMAHRVLRSFLDAQLVVAERLSLRGEDELDRKDTAARDAFVAECEKVGRQMLLQGRLHGPEGLSRELFASALDLMANLGLLVDVAAADAIDVTDAADGDATHEGLASRREASAAYARDLVRRVRAIEFLDASIRAEVTGVPD